MKIRLHQTEDGLQASYAVYKRQGITFKTYGAQIIGTDPNYCIQRAFLRRSCVANPRFYKFSYPLENDGILEFVIKRYDKASGRFLSWERKWVVVYDGTVRIYDDDEMNYQYVLYCSWLLALSA